MGFDVAGALIFGGIAFLMVRNRTGLGSITAVAFLAGFFVAGTGMHDSIAGVLHAVASGISHATHHH